MTWRLRIPKGMACAAWLLALALGACTSGDGSAPANLDSGPLDSSAPRAITERALAANPGTRLSLEQLAILHLQPGEDAGDTGGAGFDRVAYRIGRSIQVQLAIHADAAQVGRLALLDSRGNEIVSVAGAGRSSLPATLVPGIYFVQLRHARAGDPAAASQTVFVRALGFDPSATGTRVTLSASANCLNCNFTSADLQNQDFSGLELDGSKFGNAKMGSAKFVGTSMKYCVFWTYTGPLGTLNYKTDLTKTDFSQANLFWAQFKGVTGTGAIFEGARLGYTNWGAVFVIASEIEPALYSMLQQADFGNAHAEYADFRGAKITDSSFQGADLAHARLDSPAETQPALMNDNITSFSGSSFARNAASGQATSLAAANLTNTDFSGLDLSDADFTGATLSQTLFVGANVSRAQFKDVQPAATFGAAFQNATFSGVQFEGVDLSHADLSAATLGNADLTQVSFVGATLSDVSTKSGVNLAGRSFEPAFAQFHGMDLSFAVLTGVSLPQADLQGALLANAQLQNATLTRANLAAADLNNAQLQGALLNRADLSGANLDNAYLADNNNGVVSRSASLEQARLKNVNLSSAQLSGVDFSLANFYGDVAAGQSQCTTTGENSYAGFTQHCAAAHNAKMDGTVFEGAYLYGVDFTGAQIKGANFQQAVLTGTNFSGASFATNTDSGNAALFSRAFLQGANLQDATFSPGVDLTDAFLDFTPTGNGIYVLLDGPSHNVFAGCPPESGGPDSPPPCGQDVCVALTYGQPSTVPNSTPNSTVCPNGTRGDCGPAAGKANTRWESSLDIGKPPAAVPRAWYASAATWTPVPTNPADICGGQGADAALFSW